MSTKEVTWDPSPEEIAEAIWEMDSDDQASVLRHLAEHAVRECREGYEKETHWWPTPDHQWWYVGSALVTTHENYDVISMIVGVYEGMLKPASCYVEQVQRENRGWYQPHVYLPTRGE